MILYVGSLRGGEILQKFLQPTRINSERSECKKDAGRTIIAHQLQRLVHLGASLYSLVNRKEACYFSIPQMTLAFRKSIILATFGGK